MFSSGDESMYDSFSSDDSGTLTDRTDSDNEPYTTIDIGNYFLNPQRPAFACSKSNPNLSRFPTQYLARERGKQRFHCSGSFDTKRSVSPKIAKKTFPEGTFPRVGRAKTTDLPIVPTIVIDSNVNSGSPLRSSMEIDIQKPKSQRQQFLASRSKSLMDMSVQSYLPQPILPELGSKPNLTRGNDQENQENTSIQSSSQPLPTTTNPYAGKPARDIRSLRQSTNSILYPQKLPVLRRGTSGDYIARNTVVSLIKGEHQNRFNEYWIIDCRFDFEFTGGHIKNAINIIPSQLEDKLTEIFFNVPVPPTKSNCAIIFHCEFSSKRGPAACKALRKMDRRANRASYPILSYPYVYIMEGGYRDFFHEYPNTCVGGYVEMKDKRFAADLKHNKRLDKMKKMRSNSVTVVRQKIRTSASLSNFNL